MNFFEQFRTGRLFSGSNRLPEQVVKLIFMEKNYILEEFDIGFHQDINSKGQPEGLPRGGIMNLTFAGAPDEFINEWMARTDLLRNGEIRFLSGELKVTGGAELIIVFEDAYCVAYSKHIDTRKGGLLTTLKISPRRVKLQNEEFTNRWQREEALPYYIRSGKDQ